MGMNKNGLCFRLMALAFLSALMVTASAQQLKYTSIAQIGTSYKGSVQPLKPLVSQGGQCSAWSPAHWVISGVSPQGNALDLILPDKSMYAGYLSVGIPGSKAYKDTAFASPRAFLNTTISESGKYKVTWGKPLQDKLGMTILSFEIMDPNDSRQGKGVVIYQVTKVPGDIDGYIIESYTAQTFKDLWASQGAEAIAVALSIRCTGGARTYGSTYRSIYPKKIESFYAKEVGLDFAHNPTTGENYWVNVVTDKNVQGAQGPGYYLKSGNDLKKLLPGRKE
jgi:hypothetical protein